MQEYNRTGTVFRSPIVRNPEDISGVLRQWPLWPVSDEYSLHALVSLYCRVPLGFITPSLEVVTQGDACIPKERPPGDSNGVEREEERSRVGVCTVWNGSPSAFFKHAENLEQHLLACGRERIQRGKRRVVNRPMEPGEHLLAADGRPRHLTEPRPKVVSEVDRARVVSLERDDVFLGAPRSAYVFLIVAVLWEFRESRLQYPPERRLQFVEITVTG